MTEIAFLGTGLLGSGIAHGLLDRGARLAVWNRTRARTQPLGERGARVAADAADAVKHAERVHLCLASDDTVDAVLDLLLPALPAGVVIVDHSTTSPRATAYRAARLAARGVAFLHAPVFMSPQAAREGTGILLASGPEDIYRRVESALRPMARELRYLGQAPERAAAFKLFGNALLITVTAGLADIFTMAQGLHIAPADVLALFQGFNPAAMILGGRGPRMVQGDFAAGFELTMARKDVALMIDSATPSGAPLAVLPAIVERLDTLVRQGHGNKDLGALAIDAITAPSRPGT